ncbi:chemotaxis-specific protein-glutamate methyltransferase CheB [Halomonas sp. SIMBA_159]
MSVIRVVVADDSQLAREVLREILTRDGDIEIVGEATNGQEAVEMAKRLSPQLITMDLTMPVMDGLSAIEEIMYTKGVPIVVVSDRSDAQTAYQALEVGALEVLPKPGLEEEDAERLLARIRLLSGVSVITRLRRRTSAALTPAPVRLPITSPCPTAMSRGFQQIVAIACSTGGPQALARLLSKLPKGFPAPVIIAQHISPGFIDGMATWLGSLCALPVSVAQSGERLMPGHIYLVPPESQMKITAQHRFLLTPSPSDALYHPSCDTMLHSVASVYGTDSIGVILTGMGRDGVSGLRAIQLAGGATLAQDEASSVIYGMNQEAVNAGVVQQVMGLDDLPARLLREVRFTPSPWQEPQ